MNTLYTSFLDDEFGFIISAELVIVMTVLVIGMVTGLVCVQTAVVGELKDVGSSISALDQSYSYSGFMKGRTRGCFSYTPGSAFTNIEGTCQAVHGLQQSNAAIEEETFHNPEGIVLESDPAPSQEVIPPAPSTTVCPLPETQPGVPVCPAPENIQTPPVHVPPATVPSTTLPPTTQPQESIPHLPEAKGPQFHGPGSLPGN